MGRGTSRRHTPLTRALSKVVSAKCAERGLTQTQVAEFIGTSQGQAGKLLNGDKAMTFFELDLICKGLGIKTFEVIKEAEAIVRRQPTPDHFTLAASEREPDPYEGLGEESQDV